MPAVAAAALMEYSGLALKVDSIVGARRDVELRLEDLEGLAEQLAGDFEVHIVLPTLSLPPRCVQNLLGSYFCSGKTMPHTTQPSPSTFDDYLAHTVPSTTLNTFSSR